MLLVEIAKNISLLLSFVFYLFIPLHSNSHIALIIRLHLEEL